MNEMAKILIVLGLLLVAVGVLLLLFGKFPFDLGKLPGDIVIRRENFTLYLPIATSILVSIVLSLLFWLISRFLR